MSRLDEIKETLRIHNELAPSQLNYLIERCEKLEAALKKSETFTYSDAQHELLENQLGIAVEALKLTTNHWNHPMKDHNWAYYIKEQHENALAEIEKLGGTK